MPVQRKSSKTVAPQNVAITMKAAEESGRSHSKAMTARSHPKHGPAQQHTFHGNEQRRGKK